MGKRIHQFGAVLLTGILLQAAGTAVGAVKTASTEAPWTFRADWTGGFSGWMSFPLAQDVGFDPSLYTEKQGDATVLRHNFLAHGQTTAWFGMVRPLAFTANAQSEVRLRYRLKLAAPMTQTEVIFAGADGRRYSAALPSGAGEHTVRITGAAMHLVGNTQVQAIIMRGRLQQPPVDSQSVWMLEEFVLHAERAAQVSLTAPQLNTAVDGKLVAEQALFPGDDLQIVRKASTLPAHVSIYDSDGKLVGEHDLAAQETAASLPVGAAPAAGLWRAEIQQGGAHTSFQFLVLNAVPPHARLLLPKARIDELRDEPRYASLRKQIHQRAQTLATKLTYNAYAGMNVELMPSGPGIEPALPGQLKPYIELVENYSDAAAYNALDYRLNGGKTALAFARRALATMEQWPTWVPPRFQQHGLYTYYEVGVIAQRVAFGYDLIADELTPKEKENLAVALRKQVIDPTVAEYFTYNRDPIAASNWMANSVGGAIESAVAIAGDTPEWKQKEAPAIAKLEFAYEELLQGLFPGDGSEAEPYGYENFAMQGFSWGMSSLHALQIHPAGSERMVQAFWWPYYVTVKQGMQLDTGDFNGHLTGLPGFAWGAAFTGIPELQALYDSGTHLDLSKGADSGQNGHLLEENLGPIDLACCSKPVPAFEPPAPSRVFPLRGSAALRSGWSPDSTVISLRAGPWFNHEHDDEGSFQVAAFGSELISEAGYASYYTDPRFPDYFTQAAAHNTLLIDGDPFSQAALAPRFWAALEHPHFTAQMLGTNFDYLSVDLTTAYDGRVEKYQRQFVFLKPDILIVRDEVHAAQKHVYSWLLHTPQDSAASHDGDQATIQTRLAHASLTAAGGNAAWSLANTPIQVTLFTDLDRQHIEPSREFVLTSPATASTQFMVGMTFAAGAASASSGMESWTEAAGVGLRTRGTDGEQASVVFRSGAGQLTLGDLSTDGSMVARESDDGHGWMVVGARDVTRGGEPLLHASATADVTWEPVTGGLDLTVNANGATTLEIARANAPASVSIDGHAAPLTYRLHMVAVSVAAGEHHVSLR